MIKLKVMNYADRVHVLSALADNGYIVTIEEREQVDHYLKKDYFVVIMAEPELPEYRPEFIRM